MESSQNQQLEDLKNALQRHEDGMMEVFIQEGPDALRRMLAVGSDNDWKLIFDYLVTRKNVLEKCALDYMPFFKDLVVKSGPSALRKIFKLDSPEYEQSFKRLLELVAVSHGAIYQHVLLNSNVLARRIMNGQSSSLRNELCISDRKYEALWSEILEVLRNAVCQNVYDEKICEDGFRAMIAFFNTIREHRSLISYKGVWTYSD